jgi:hypothetical protein
VVSLPVSAFVTSNQFIVGNATLQDLGGSIYYGRAELANGTGILLSSEYTAGTWNTLGVIDSTGPTTWTSTDIWTITGTYEAA